MDVIAERENSPLLLLLLGFFACFGLVVVVGIGVGVVVVIASRPSYD